MAMRGLLHENLGGFRSNYRGSSSNIFVDNLPKNAEVAWFRKLFSNFGRVIEAYIPNKRSKVIGNRFGFIRYANRRDAIHAIAKSNGLWVGKRNLVVKMARYDRRNTFNDDFQHKSSANQFPPLVNFQKPYVENASTSLE